MVEPRATAERIERLRAATKEAGLDAYLATSDESVAYLTGFRPLQMERFFGVVVRADGGGAVIVPKLDEGQVAGAPASLDRVSYTAASNGLPELQQLLDGAQGVGVEEDHVIFARTRALQAAGVAVFRSVTTSPETMRCSSPVDSRTRSAPVSSNSSATPSTTRCSSIARTVDPRVEDIRRQTDAIGASPSRSC